MQNETFREKLDEPYRLMCPNKHHQLHEQGGRTVYCDQCSHAWRYEDIIDKKQTKSRSVVPPKEV